MRPAAILTAPLAGLLGACMTATPSVDDRTARCPISSSSNWNAWIDAMPGTEGPKLIVTGTVVAPTGGYTFAWRDLRRMESDPVQIVAELEALPPDGMATQALDSHDLRGEWAQSPPVGSVTITCGSRTLARISPVKTTS